MNVRLIDLKQDYPIFENWWEQHDFPVVHESMLSQFGFIVSDENKDLVAGWMYPTQGSQICWLGFPIANPDSTEKERDEALDILYSNLGETAQQMGYHWLYVTTDHPKLKERFEKYNFKKGDDLVTQYWRRI